MRGRMEAADDLATEWDRPWLLVGAGFRSTAGAWRGEFGGAQGASDPGEQVRLWRSFGWAYHNALAEGKGPDGVIVDTWDVDLFAPNGPRGYDLRGKPDLWPLLRGVWRP